MTTDWVGRYYVKETTLLGISFLPSIAYKVTNQTSEGFHWGVAAEYLYGGMLDVDKQSRRPVALGGSGSVDGSYDNTGAIILGLYGSWKF